MKLSNKLSTVVMTALLGMGSTLVFAEDGAERSHQARQDFLATQQQIHGQTDNIAHSDAAKKPVQTSSTSVSGQHPDA